MGKDKISIVIPLAANGFGSRWNDTELKYCFRSIEKHLSGYGDIFLIGHKPAWTQNVIHIPATDGDKTWDKERNIFNKIMIACNDERVTEDFLFMNDDHYLLKDYAAGEFPNYCYGYLTDHTAREDQYGNSVKNTIEWTQPPDLYFDIHCPIVYNKKSFKSLQQFDWTKKYGYCIKSLYMSRFVPYKAFEHSDLKINQPLPSIKIKQLISGRHWFSIGNKAREGGIGAVLEELYNKKSKYEKL